MQERRTRIAWWSSHPCSALMVGWHLESRIYAERQKQSGSRLGWGQFMQSFSNNMHHDSKAHKHDVCIIPMKCLCEERWYVPVGVGQTLWATSTARSLASVVFLSNRVTVEHLSSAYERRRWFYLSYISVCVIVLDTTMSSDCFFWAPTYSSTQIQQACCLKSYTGKLNPVTRCNHAHYTQTVMHFSKWNKMIEPRVSLSWYLILNSRQVIAH